LLILVLLLAMLAGGQGCLFCVVELSFLVREPLPTVNQCEISRAKAQKNFSRGGTVASWSANPSDAFLVVGLCGHC